MPLMGDNRLDSEQALGIKKETELIPALLLVGQVAAVAAAVAAAAAKEVLGSQGR